VGAPGTLLKAKRHTRCVLTIAGSDSGGGAGIQADSRTIHALGGFALTAITAITAQNTRGVVSWNAVPPALVSAQIAVVIEDLAVTAIKTGLLPSAATVRAVVAALGARPGVPLVVDPVIGSTSGTRFLSRTGLRTLREELIPRATLVTPNWPEIAALTGRAPLRTWSDVEAAARELLAGGCGAVLVKGGHAPGRVCRDCLVTSDGTVCWFDSARVATANTHGTGCVLSAGIATRLGGGDDVATAVTSAREFLQQSLRANRNDRWGAGAGPAFPG
jgi:hydroxymethylpyrimidine/phosphomethylpyrimidine kinase